MYWKEKDLGELVSLKQGFALNAKSKHYIAESGIPLLKISDLFNNTETLFVNEQIPKQFLVYADEIIYTRTAQVGYAFMGKTGVIYNNCFKVIPDETQVDKHFLYLWLNSKHIRTFAQTLATGTAQQDLNHGAFKSIKIKLPPLNIQQKIASLLSNYDKLIENNSQRIKLLESMAEEMYKEWFVRLRFPWYEDVEVVDGVPVGWEKKKLGSVYKTSSGSTPSRKIEENFNGNIPWIKTGELKNMFVLDTDETISELGLNNSSAKLFPKNTVLIAMYCAMPELSLLAYPSTTNQACCAFLPKEDYLHYSFSYMFIKYAQKGLISHAHGAAQQNLSQDIILEYKIIFPEKDLIINYGQATESMFEEIKLLMQKNNKLKETRDLLLPRLMSGKLNVEDLDII